MTKDERHLIASHAKTLDAPEIRNLVILFEALSKVCRSVPRAEDYTAKAEIYANRYGVVLATEAGS